jgi:PAS domain S-box-containing protein
MQAAAGAALEVPVPTLTKSDLETRIDDPYRLLLDAVVDYAIYMLDVEGRIVSWNSGAQRLKGYTAEEILGRHFSTFYPSEEVAKGTPARALAIAAREGRFEAQGWRCAKGGRRFWAQVLIRPIRDAGGGLIGYAKVTRDLSERKAAEDALERSEEQFRMLVQAVTDYAIFMLDRNGIVTNWNAGARRAKGYEPHEVIGTHFSRFYRPEDRADGLPARALATAAAEGRFEGEGWRVRKDGSQFWANVVIDPILDDGGKVIGFAKVTRDITDKRNAQIALEQAREALFQSQKLDAIGQLTGGVAHDFNNLLMVILTSLELLRRYAPVDERISRLVSNATSAAKRGVSLTERMLAFARRQELRPTAVALPALMLGMQDMIERTLGPSIHVVEHFPSELPLVLADAHQLELAVLNLAVNARDAMPSGGELRFSASELDAGAADGLPQGRYVKLSVADTGCGMDAATLARALEPFFTTKGVGKGTGLGLAMVHGLAVQSGGKFELQSTPGKGTSALLWLPVAPAVTAAGPAPAVDSKMPLQPVPPMLVVCVDDDPLVLAGAVSLLEALGHQVIAVSSAAQALAALRKEPRVGLVISDQLMPGMSGMQLFDALQKERPDLPFILVSGFAETPSDPEQRVPRLAKPFGFEQLARVISRVMAAGTKS